MKVIKNINNNVSLCVDSRGKEVVAFGKGIGFVKAPNEIPLSRIDRTFYNIQDISTESLAGISNKAILTAMKIVDLAGDELNVNFPSSAVLILADHISFAAERTEKHMYLDMPIVEDIRMLYPEEMAIAYRALKIIEEEMQVSLPRNEAGTIALHFINDRFHVKKDSSHSSEAIIRECVEEIEQIFGIAISRESFNYSRFVTHMDFLMRRLAQSEQISSTNEAMFEQLKAQYPKTYECTEAINAVFHKHLNIDLTDEEKMYVLLHVNRLTGRAAEE